MLYRQKHYSFIIDNPKKYGKNRYNKNKNYLGLAIGVKTTNAVERNKIKRLLRANYTVIENNLKFGKSIVFLWNKKIKLENANFYNIKKDMINIFEKANILIGKDE